MLNLTRQLVATALQKAVQQYLDLDPESKPRLQALAGKTVLLELQGISQAGYRTQRIKMEVCNY